MERRREKGKGSRGHFCRHYASLNLLCDSELVVLCCIVRL